MSSSFADSIPAEPVDPRALDGHVQAMYERVANEPQGEFHFHLGRALAERLGYDARLLDRVPAGAIESFAGVGHHFDLARLRAGERVLDLGSGSGMDSFVAALQVGSTGSVDGVDMTTAQHDKSAQLRAGGGFEHVCFHQGRIEKLPFDDQSFDCVISNGVINLIADKASVFREAARVLRPGGRLAISDIVSDDALPASVVCDVTLWASCIGGAMQRIEYQDAIAGAGFEVELVQRNAYEFVRGRAERSARKFGVRSISLLAVKQ